MAAVGRGCAGCGARRGGIMVGREGCMGRGGMGICLGLTVGLVG